MPLLVPALDPTRQLDTVVSSVSLGRDAKSFEELPVIRLRHAGSAKGAWSRASSPAQAAPESLPNN